MKSIESKIADLENEIKRLTRVHAIKDRVLDQQQKKIAELMRRLSTQSSQIANLSTQIARMR